MDGRHTTAHTAWAAAGWVRLEFEGPKSGCWYRRETKRLNWQDAANMCEGLTPEGYAGTLAAPQTVDEAHAIERLDGGSSGKLRWTAGRRLKFGSSFENRALDDTVLEVPFMIDVLDLWYPGEPSRGPDQAACIAQGKSPKSEDVTPHKVMIGLLRRISLNDPRGRKS